METTPVCNPNICRVLLGTAGYFQIKSNHLLGHKLRTFIVMTIQLYLYILWPGSYFGVLWGAVGYCGVLWGYWVVLWLLQGTGGIVGYWGVWGYLGVIEGSGGHSGVL